MVMHGPGLVLRVGLVVHGDRTGCAWCLGWLCMGSGLGCGSRAGCTWGQGQVCETMQACMDIIKCQCLLYKTVRALL